MFYVRITKSWECLLSPVQFFCPSRWQSTCWVFKARLLCDYKCITYKATNWLGKLELMHDGINAQVFDCQNANQQKLQSCPARAIKVPTPYTQSNNMKMLLLLLVGASTYEDSPSKTSKRWRGYLWFLLVCHACRCTNNKMHICHHMCFSNGILQNNCTWPVHWIQCSTGNSGKIHTMQLIDGDQICIPWRPEFV